jgi:hypothetical protein
MRFLDLPYDLGNRIHVGRPAGDSHSRSAEVEDVNMTVGKAWKDCRTFEIEDLSGEGHLFPYLVQAADRRDPIRDDGDRP